MSSTPRFRLRTHIAATVLLVFLCVVVAGYVASLVVGSSYTLQVQRATTNDSSFHRGDVVVLQSVPAAALRTDDVFTHRGADGRDDLVRVTSRRDRFGETDLKVMQLQTGETLDVALNGTDVTESVAQRLPYAGLVTLPTANWWRSFGVIAFVAVLFTTLLSTLVGRARRYGVRRETIVDVDIPHELLR